MGHSEAATLAALRECRDQVVALCTPLDEVQWHAATALPGWDVQDVVAHLGSLEGMLLGRAEPETPGAVREWTHVRNPLGQLNEAMVDRRRAWSAAEVFDEFRETSELRLEQLGGLSEDDLDAAVPAPDGSTVPQRRFLGIRLWDYVLHEMDIADALGREPRVESPGAEQVLSEMAFLLPRALGRSGATEGTTVRIDLGPPGRTMAARIENGRGVAADVATGEAALHLRASPAAFLRVATGRRPAADAVESGDVEVTGVGALAAAVLKRFNVIP